MSIFTSYLRYRTDNYKLENIKIISNYYWAPSNTRVCLILMRDTSQDTLPHSYTILHVFGVIPLGEDEVS